MTMLEENYFAILTDNLERTHINGVITYEQIGSAKVKNIFKDIDTKFYKGKYKLPNSSNFEFDCLIKKIYDQNKYHVAKYIRHPNVVKLVSYDIQNKNVLIRHMQGFGTFESYRKMFQSELIDYSGTITEKFKNFIRTLLNTLRFLYEEEKAHGCLEAKHILVWNQNEELDLKLFEISVDLYSKDDESIRREIHNDLQKLGQLIRTTGHHLNSSVIYFCDYLESGSIYHKVDVDDALHYPTFTNMTMNEMAIYIEKVIESRPSKYHAVNNLSGIEWLDDFETDLRKDIDEESTGTHI